MPEIFPDGTFLQEAYDGTIFEVRDGGQELIVRHIGDNPTYSPGQTLRSVIPGDTYMLTHMNTIYGGTPVVPCECPRHQGELTFHAVRT